MAPKLVDWVLDDKATATNYLKNSKAIPQGYVGTLVTMFVNNADHSSTNLKLWKVRANRKWCLWRTATVAATTSISMVTRLVLAEGERLQLTIDTLTVGDLVQWTAQLVLYPIAEWDGRTI